MENVPADNDLLNIDISINAAPYIKFEKEEQPGVSSLAPYGSPDSFNISVNAALKFNSLSGVATQYLKNKRIQLSEGLFKKYIVIQRCKMYGDGTEKIIIEADFTGSFTGTFYFTGEPHYNPALKSIEIQNLNYDLKTTDWLLKTAKWLFNNRIVSELKKHTSFTISGLYANLIQKINSGLQREWTKDIESKGAVTDLTITDIHTLKDALLLRCLCRGNLTVKINY